MKNNNFALEKYEANKFLEQHRGDVELTDFIMSFSKMNCLPSHSEIWSEVYDFLYEKDYNTNYATGITYIIES